MALPVALAPKIQRAAKEHGPEKEQHGERYCQKRSEPRVSWIGAPTKLKYQLRRNRDSRDEYRLCPKPTTEREQEHGTEDQE
jgi:hypothetical protein